MSDKKSKVSDKASEIAKSIWLAGLGAYGKAYDDAQGKLDKAAKEPPRLFKELVEKGAKLEDEVRDSLSNIRKSGANSVEERIKKVRETFNLSMHRHEDLAAIEAKLDALTKKVDALAKAVGSSGKPATRRKATAKASTKRKTPGKRAGTGAASTTARKAPTKKATASKPASKKAASKRSGGKTS